MHEWIKYEYKDRRFYYASISGNLWLPVSHYSLRPNECREVEKRKRTRGVIYDKILEKLYLDALAKLEVVWEVSRNGSYILFHSVPIQMFTWKFLGEMKNYGLQSYNKDHHSIAIFENVRISDILLSILDVLCLLS